MHVRSKVCGITEIEDLLMVVREGVDAVGFIRAAESPRYISSSRTRVLCAKTPPFITRVGVYVDESPAFLRDQVLELGLDAVQLHGSEDPDSICRLKTLLTSPAFKSEGKDGSAGVRIIKGFRIGSEKSVVEMKPYRDVVDAFLLDTLVRGKAGGTGQTFDWDLFNRAKMEGLGPLILAGGLNPENIGEAVACTRPYAVDVSSGVESQPGRKDPRKVRDFLARLSSTGTC